MKALMKFAVTPHGERYVPDNSNSENRSISAAVTLMGTALRSHLLCYDNDIL
jgi:hypothetical protein